MGAIGTGSSLSLGSPTLNSPLSGSPGAHATLLASVRDLDLELRRVLGNKRLKAELLKSAERAHCSEGFRFMASLFELEVVAAKPQRRALASKIIGTFVDPGSRFELGCISSATRDKLVKRHNLADPRLFDAARAEVLVDVRRFDSRLAPCATAWMD